MVRTRLASTPMPLHRLRNIGLALSWKEWLTARCALACVKEWYTFRNRVDASTPWQPCLFLQRPLVERAGTHRRLIARVAEQPAMKLAEVAASPTHGLHANTANSMSTTTNTTTNVITVLRLVCRVITCTPIRTKTFDLEVHPP